MRHGAPLLLILALALGLSGSLAAAPGTTMQDRTFVTNAGHAGAAEIAEAKLALTKTQNQSTLAFARRMIRDHTALAAKLKLAAKAFGLTPPAKPSSMQTASITALGKLKGTAFLNKYRQSQISAHTSAIALFTAESEHGQAAALRSAATAALPILKMHLKMAQAMST